MRTNFYWNQSIFDQHRAKDKLAVGTVFWDTYSVYQHCELQSIVDFLVGDNRTFFFSSYRSGYSNRIRQKVESQAPSADPVSGWSRMEPLDLAAPCWVFIFNVCNELCCHISLNKHSLKFVWIFEYLSKVLLQIYCRVQR